MFLTPRRLRLWTAALLAGLSLSALAAEGEVRKINAAQAKITIKSGPIANLDMPPMTMVFKATPSLLNGLAEGDKVSFEAAQVDGQYVVTSIRKLP
jgi:Cu/Ag efflux protein CusF